MEPRGTASSDTDDPAAHTDGATHDDQADPRDWAADLPIAVFVVGPSGDVLYVNGALDELGRRAEAPETSVSVFPWRSQVSLADRARVDSAWSHCLAGAPLRTTFDWTPECSPAAPALLRVDWVEDRHGRRLVGLLEPATDDERSTVMWSTHAAMVDHSPDATLVVSGDGTISWPNPAAAMLLGMDEDQLDGLNIVDLIHPDDLGLVAEAFADRVVGGPRIGFVVIRVRHRAGVWAYVEAAANRMVFQGRPDGLLVTCRDVTARYRHDETREMVRSRFEKAFDRAPIGMALISLEGRLVRVNHVFTEMVGRTANDLTGRSVFDLAHPEHRDAAIGHAVSMLGSGEVEPIELRFVRPDGRDAWARISSSIIHDDAGRAAHGLVHAEDITEQRQLREQLRRAATCDPLTGLLNRAGLAARFDEDAESPNPRRALMVIDLDEFKAVNDRHGHLVGDDVLCAVADRLQRCLRSGSVIARIGGDEFAIYLPEVADAPTALALAERVRDALAPPHTVGEHSPRVAGSVGVAVLDGSVELSAALGAADLASYEAKRSGGNAACLTSTSRTVVPD